MSALKQPRVTPDEKPCARCKTVKLKDQFGSNPKNVSGLMSWCRDCNKSHVKSYYERHPEKKTGPNGIGRRHALKRKYGLTIEQWEELFDSQDRKCAICFSGENNFSAANFHVDHNHETGAIRGILCGSCNVSLGHFKDDVKILRSAIDYLERR